MKFKNHPQPLSPATAARRNQHVANFRAGQVAHNQLLKNIRNIERLRNERTRILERVRNNGRTLLALQHRLQQPWYPASIRGSEQRKIAELEVRMAPSFQQIQNLEAHIRQAKRGIINVVPVRFRPAAHHPRPYHNWIVNQWSPNAFITAMRLGPGNKLRKAGIGYIERPGGPKSLKLVSNLEAHIKSMKRKRSSPRRNAGQ